MIWKISVGRRLALLVAAQTTIVFVLSYIASCSLAQMATDTDRLYSLQMLAVEDIAGTLESSAELEMLARPQDTVKSRPAPGKPGIPEIGQRIEELNAFQARYQTIWVVARGSTEDARSFRQAVIDAGGKALLDQEERALTELQQEIKELQQVDKAAPSQPSTSLWNSAIKARHGMALLLEVNMALAAVSHQQVMLREERTQMQVLLVGVGGTFITLLLGYYVRRAIAPRIERLVTKVTRFKDFGVNEKVVEEGADEITVLANALDAGFAAIAERDRERDQFLSIAAHELKTPVTSIQGFATLLLEGNANNEESRHRALEIISRQSWRLSRLIEGLFLMVRARSGTLKFTPKPLDLSALTERVVKEIRPLIVGHDVTMDVQPRLNILGDEMLLEHALWSLFSSGSSLFSKGSSWQVSLKSSGARLHLSLQANGVQPSADEMDALFTPFRAIEYENGGGARGTVGLYLSREIARIHNGRLYPESINGASVFVLELPA